MFSHIPRAPVCHPARRQTPRRGHRAAEAWDAGLATLTVLQLADLAVFLLELLADLLHGDVVGQRLGHLVDDLGGGVICGPNVVALQQERTRPSGAGARVATPPKHTDSSEHLLPLPGPAFPGSPVLAVRRSQCQPRVVIHAPSQNWQPPHEEPPGFKPLDRQTDRQNQAAKKMKTTKATASLGVLSPIGPGPPCAQWHLCPRSCQARSGLWALPLAVPSAWDAVPPPMTLPQKGS